MADWAFDGNKSTRRKTEFKSELERDKLNQIIRNQDTLQE